MNQLSSFFFFFALLFSSATSFDVKTVSFDEGFSALFGGSNVVRSVDGDGVQLRLDRYTGSGFISSDYYKYGLFSASIKLPADYTAGVVVAFYTSNGDVFDKTHDELDFEFLGNVRGHPWRVQTNVYGNGSTSRGREERYTLPFDPTKEAHRYSILWTADNIVFYVDNIPIREAVRTTAMGGDFPLKPMSLYATIWDGSTWATAGGKYKANYKYAPFISEFSELVLPGCRVGILEQLPAVERCMEAESELASAEYAVMTPRKRAAMLGFRERYMTYSFCYDTLRYPTAFPDCNIIPSEQKKFLESGNVKFVTHPRRTKRRSRMQKATDPSREAEI